MSFSTLIDYNGGQNLVVCHTCPDLVYLLQGDEGNRQHFKIGIYTSRRCAKCGGTHNRMGQTTANTGRISSRMLFKNHEKLWNYSVKDTCSECSMCNSPMATAGGPRVQWIQIRTKQPLLPRFGSRCTDLKSCLCFSLTNL